MSPSALLDCALAVLLVGHAARGWRAGALTSVLGLAGMLLGASLALWATPRAVARWGSHLEQPLPGVLLVGSLLLATVFGEQLLGGLGLRLRARTRRRGTQLADQALGAAVSMAVVAVVVSLLGGAVRPALPRSWAATMNQSRLLPPMEALTPDAAGRWASRLTQTLGEAGFPRVFSGLQPEPVIPVPTPDTAAARTAGVRRAQASVVRVEAEASACSQTHAGSGWVVAPHRVVTNAHVVAGAGSTRVQVAGTRPRLPARVVAFDPDLDLAVLAVPELDAPPLRRAGPLAPRADAVVAGFPLGGPYALRAARVRGTVQAAGDDIYGGKGVVRQVYSLASTVQPGNSGGPLLTPDGRVAGTVFARSMVDHSTGYALTDRASDALLDSAASRQRTVGTGACARG